MAQSPGSNIKDTPYFSGRIPLPEPRADGVDSQFWEAARQHRLVAQHCGACGHWQFPPEVVCMACQSRSVAWSDIPATGTLISYSRVWYPVLQSLTHDVPYLVGVVELVAPTVRMLGNIIGDPMRSLEFDMPVEAVFEDHDAEGVTLVQWRPRSD